MAVVVVVPTTVGSLATTKITVLLHLPILRILRHRKAGDQDSGLVLWLEDSPINCGTEGTTSPENPSSLYNLGVGNAHGILSLPRPLVGRHPKGDSSMKTIGGRVHQI
jgi:hypothetical protein